MHDNRCLLLQQSDFHGTSEKTESAEMCRIAGEEYRQQYDRTYRYEVANYIIGKSSTSTETWMPTFSDPTWRIGESTRGHSPKRCCARSTVDAGCPTGRTRARCSVGAVPLVGIVRHGRAHHLYPEKPQTECRTHPKNPEEPGSERPRQSDQNQHPPDPPDPSPRRRSSMPHESRSRHPRHLLPGRSSSSTGSRLRRVRAFRAGLVLAFRAGLVLRIMRIRTRNSNVRKADLVAQPRENLFRPLPRRH